MNSASRYLYAVTFILAASGFLLPWWPLCVVGIVLCALSGRAFFAVFVALLLDLAWGPPTGMLHPVVMPFTLLALTLVAARLWGGRYFLGRGMPEHL